MNIPELEVPPYLFLVALGVAAGFVSAFLLMRRAKIPLETRMLSFVLTVAGTIIGAISRSSIVRRELDIAGVPAAIGLFVSALTVTFIFKEAKILASYAVSAPLMYSIAKIGCFLGGCCKGFRTSGILSVTYEWIPGSFFPLQLVDSVIFVIIYVISAVLFIKGLDALKFALFASILMRFLTEFLRASHEGKILSKEQYILVMALCSAIIVLVVLNRYIKGWNNERRQV